jgi:acyl-coenzyme A synthetase/AMP-(fatty) acid ligase
MQCSLLHDLAPRAAKLWGDRPFLLRWLASGGLQPPISFAAFASWTELACAELRSLGVTRGTRVAVLAHACADSLALSLAVPAVGGILINLNWRHSEPTLRSLIASMDCELLVISRGLAELGRRLGAVGSVRALLMLEGCEAEPGVQSVREHAFSCDPALRRDGGGAAAEADGAPSSHQPSARGGAAPSDVAVVMFTSGTSSLPKAVPLTHCALLWSCAAKEAAEADVLGLVSPGLALQRGEASGMEAHRGTLAFLPTFHVIGFTNNFLFNLHAGVPCLLHCDAPTVPVTGRLILRACAELRPSIVDTVPALLEALVPLTAEECAPLAECAAVLYGGSSLAEHTAVSLREGGVRLCSQYGQTELGGMAMLGHPSAPHGA